MSDLASRIPCATRRNKSSAHENFIKFLFLAGNDRGGVFLVPMHGGIWTLCINLRDDEIRELGKKGFPAVAQCFNYLAGNIDNSRLGGGEEPRADWQHSEFQTPIRPHLSRYNKNVSINEPKNNPRTQPGELKFLLNVYELFSSAE